MKTYISEAIRLREAGYKTKEIAQTLFPDEPEIRAHARVRKALSRANVGKVAAKYAESLYDQNIAVEGKADGTTTFSGIIELQEGEPVTPEAIMAAHKIDPEFWEVISYKSNFWQTQTKGGKAMVLYQSKITVKPRKDTISFETIDRYFAEHEYRETAQVIPLRRTDRPKEVLEICVPDLHSGLFSWNNETGENYDMEIVRKRFLSCIDEIVDKAKNRNIGAVLLVTLGDLLHVDNDQQTTTKGTFQQVDGRFPKIFTETLNILLAAISKIEYHVAPVEVVYIQGNHDGITGYTLLKSIEMAFFNNRNVNVDTEPNPRKWRRIGLNLIGWCHGDIPNKHRTTWLHQEARMEYGLTEYAEVHAGHLHSQQTIEDNGVVYRNLPTICAASAWEHKQAFAKSHKCMMAFLWAPDEAGPKEIWYTNVNEGREKCG